MTMAAILCSGAYLEKGGKFLMVKEKNGKYNFPMGSVEPGESIEEACIREVQEETGYSVVITGLRKALYVKRKELLLMKFLFNVKIILKDRAKIKDDDIAGTYWISLEEFKQMHKKEDLRSSDMICFFKNEKTVDYYVE
jgi:8-oxo-dGTP pyrophosphatase MutT (NUDIX family)